MSIADPLYGDFTLPVPSKHDEQTPVLALPLIPYYR